MYYKLQINMKRIFVLHITHYRL